MASDHGLTAWRAVFDRITIDKLPVGMRALKIVDLGRVVFERVLDADQAAHLAKLLTD